MQRENDTSDISSEPKARPSPQRVSTGIPGLDELMNGGIPKTHLMLVTGTSGTGKTTFSSQFIWDGLTKHKENAVYLSFEEPAECIMANMAEFGWDLSKYEKKGNFAFIKYDPFHIEDVFNILESKVREINATRVVVDSVSAIGLHVKDSMELRRMIYNLSIILRKLGCTAVLVSEIVPGSTGISRYGVEEFVTDGVIVLYYERVQSQFSRALQVWKIRGSSHSEKLHPYKIDNNGVTVYSKEEAFIKR